MAPSTPSGCLRCRDWKRVSSPSPGAKLEVQYLTPEKIYEYVGADRVDLGLVSYPEPTREIAVLPWRREEMVLATCPSHPWRLASRSIPRT